MTANVLDYGKLETMLRKPIDPVFIFIQHVPYMIQIARQKGLAEAYSYRDFHVAGGAYAINHSLRQSWEDTAGNVKRQVKEKVCAEKRLDARAIKAGMTEMVGFVVLGTTDRDQIEAVSGLPTPTLHWCSVCRQDRPLSPLVSPSTLIVTSGLETDVNQTMLVGQMVELYADVEQGEISPQLLKYAPDFSDWEQRVATYAVLSGGPEAIRLPIAERQRLAQLSLSKTVSIF